MKTIPAEQSVPVVPLMTEDVSPFQRDLAVSLAHRNAVDGQPPVRLILRQDENGEVNFVPQDEYAIGASTVVTGLYRTAHTFAGERLITEQPAAMNFEPIAVGGLKGLLRRLRGDYRDYRATLVGLPGSVVTTETRPLAESIF